VTRIVEERDASGRRALDRRDQHRHPAAPTLQLKSWVANCATSMAQREYYLTDVIELAVREGRR